MGILKTFSVGGVHPPENKLSADQAIEVLPLPKQAFIPLNQNLGAPGVAQVQKGDVIKVGQLLAKGEAFISSNVHSPVSGKVLKIDNVMDPSGYRRPAVVVNVDGDEWVDGIDRTDTLVKEIKLSQKEIVEKIHQLGIVGLGGATFPSHVKLMVPEGKTADVLIINGVECEPYLTADHRLMIEKGDEVMVGTTILMKGLGVERAIIGIENNKPDAIKNMTELAGKYKGIEVCPLKVKYPQGGEKQLIKATIKREVPSGKLPIEVGAVVNNVGTAFAVYEAVQKNKPLIERVVTITGKSVAKPGNFMVRIGTPIRELIEKAGGLPEDSGKMIGGGPMMGKALLSMDTPVVKGSSGILILRESESKRVDVKNCIRCARCVSVCPMGLEPVLLAQLAEMEMWEESEQENVMDCIECGSCHYTCPSGRPLLDYIRLGKNKVGQIIRNRGKK
ncbi:MAG: electron transport complex subunit RsxC [Bacteroidetes bacterium]|nr:MAG: electron transport complex subunit RsxC [Bacteroidota bacterium]